MWNIYHNYGTHMGLCMFSVYMPAHLDIRKQIHNLELERKIYFNNIESRKLLIIIPLLPIIYYLICHNKITNSFTSLRQGVFATITATYQVSAIVWFVHIASKFTVINLSTLAMTFRVDERFTRTT